MHKNKGDTHEAFTFGSSQNVMPRWARNQFFGSLVSESLLQEEKIELVVKLTIFRVLCITQNLHPYYNERYKFHED